MTAASVVTQHRLVAFVILSPLRHLNSRPTYRLIAQIDHNSTDTQRLIVKLDADS